VNSANPPGLLKIVIPSLSLNARNTPKTVSMGARARNPGPYVSGISGRLFVSTCNALSYLSSATTTVTAFATFTSTLDGYLTATASFPRSMFAFAIFTALTTFSVTLALAAFIPILAVTFAFACRTMFAFAIFTAFAFCLGIDRAYCQRP